MELTAPVVLTGNVAGAYAMKFKVQGVEGDVDLLTILQFLADNSGGGGSSVYINSDWVIKGSEGIEVTTVLPGSYSINVPEGKAIESIQTRIIDELTELNADGNITIVTAWNTTVFNQGQITALSPSVIFFDELGRQWAPSELGIEVATSALIGATSTQIKIFRNLPTPFSIKLIY